MEDIRSLQWLSISIHALREEGDLVINPNKWTKKISIHALREEGDMISPPSGSVVHYFYPRPPRGGRRLIPFQTFSMF